MKMSKKTESSFLIVLLKIVQNIKNKQLPLNAVRQLLLCGEKSS
jgi:hypothetical protein